MKVLVTGVAGQLGHDVMNELAKLYEGVGSDIKETYSGIQDDGSGSMPYVQMDITDEDSVRRKVLTDAAPDVVVHCAAWTAVDLAEDEDKKEIVHAGERDWNKEYRGGLQRTGLQDGISQYRLCIRRPGNRSLAAGLQGL